MKTMKTKLKDLKYEVPGTESKRPLNELIESVAIGFCLAAALFFLWLTVYKFIFYEN